MEKWERWDNKDLVADAYELNHLIQDRDGLKLVFLGLETEVVIVYNEQLLSFRSCDEGDRWNTIANVLADHGKHFFRQGLVYKVTESSYASWFAGETFNSTKVDEILHLAFVTANDIIEVLSLQEPAIAVSPFKSSSDFERPY